MNILFCYANRLAGKKTILFRFAVTDYLAYDGFVYKVDAFDDSVPSISCPVYAAKQTVFLDFDVIWLKFAKDDVLTIVPTVSSPIDVVAGLVPPPSRGLSLLEKILIAVGVLILFVLFCVLIKPLGKAIIWFLKMLWRILCAPFKAISKAVNKRKAGRKNDTSAKK